MFLLGLTRVFGLGQHRNCKNVKTPGPGLFHSVFAGGKINLWILVSFAFVFISLPLALPSDTFAPLESGSLLMPPEEARGIESFGSGRSLLGRHTPHYHSTTRN